MDEDQVEKLYRLYVEKADRNGVCYWGSDKIAQIVGCHVKSVPRLRKKLAKGGRVKELTEHEKAGFRPPYTARSCHVLIVGRHNVENVRYHKQQQQQPSTSRLEILQNAALGEILPEEQQSFPSGSGASHPRDDAAAAGCDEDGPIPPFDTDDPLLLESPPPFVPTPSTDDREIAVERAVEAMTSAASLNGLSITAADAVDILAAAPRLIPHVGRIATHYAKYVIHNPGGWWRRAARRPDLYGLDEAGLRVVTHREERDKERRAAKFAQYPKGDVSATEANGERLLRSVNDDERTEIVDGLIATLTRMGRPDVIRLFYEPHPEDGRNNRAICWGVGKYVYAEWTERRRRREGLRMASA